MRERRFAAVMTVALAVALVARTTASGAAAPASGTPITFGTISQLSGPFQIGTSAGVALQAYFNEWNRRGGYKGHPLKLVIRDGGTQPDQVAAAARELVDQDNVVGLIGSTLFSDCPVNRAFYQAKGVPVMIPIFDQACQESKVIFPVTTSTALLHLPAMKWAIDTKRAERFALVATDLPGTRDAAANLKRFAAKNGVKLVAQEFLPAGSPDFTGAAVRIKDAKPDTVLSLLDPPTTLGMLNAAKEQGVGIPDGITWISPPSSYFPRFSSFGPAVQGLYVTSANEPFEAQTPIVEKMRKAVLAEDPKVTLDGFVPVGWSTGILLEDALRKVKGNVTRDSLLKALSSTKKAVPATTPLPLLWGALPRLEAPAVRMLQVNGNNFDLLSDWIEVPNVKGYK